MTALGIYIIASLFFVVIGWAEFALVLCLNHFNKRIEKEERVFQNGANSISMYHDINNKEESFLTIEHSEANVLCKKARLFDIKTIDNTALLLNIILMLVFNLLYWLKFKYNIL